MDSERSQAMPLDVKRQVRQRCGFGCVICGLPLYEYVNIAGDPHDQGYVIENTTLLCHAHYQEKQQGMLSSERITQANANPYNRQSGVTTNCFLDYKGESLNVTLGDSRFIFEKLAEAHFVAPLVIDGLVITGFRYEQDRLFLNFIAFDEFNKPIVQIKDNELVYDGAKWETEWIGHSLTVKEPGGEILLQLIFNPPADISITRGRVLRSGVELMIGDDYVFNTNDSMLFNPMTVQNCTVGISLGYPTPACRAGRVIKDISRYRFDRAKALEFLEEELRKKAAF